MTDQATKSLFQKDLKSFQKSFATRLSRYLRQKEAEARKISPEYYQLVKYIGEYVQAGGKRIRPFLLCRGCRIAGASSSAKANKAGLAFELFHNFALIHDDIMDGADLRRGKPALHKQLTTWHRRKRWRGNSEEFGVGMAIMAGDILFTWSDELIGSLQIAGVNKIYQQMKNELMIGQAEDVFLGKINKIPARSRVVNTAIMKSALYSVEKPMLMGAAVVGQEKKYGKIFHEIAEALGLAFQLRDDMLDVFGDKKKVGKVVGGDIVEGKMTLLMHLALKEGSIPAGVLGKAWGNKKASSQDVNELKKYLRKSTAPTKINDEISKQLAKASKAIERTKLISRRDKELFSQILEFFAQREN